MPPRATSVVINIRGDGESAARALEMVEDKLAATRAKAESESGLIAHAMTRIGETFSGIALYEVAMEAARGLKELTLGSFEMGEQLEKASKKTGLAVETLSVLRYAANVTGSDFDGMTGAVAKMDSTIAAATQGNAKASAFIKSLGLDAKGLAGDARGAETAFKAFAEKIAATENPIRRVELARGLLGKQGAELIPMLTEVGGHWDEFVEKAKKAGVYLNGEQAAVLAETNRKMKEMSQAVTGAGVAFSEGLGPGLVQVLNLMSGGKGTMEAFRETGINIAKDFALVAEVVTSAAAAIQLLFAAGEGGKFTEAGRKDRQAFFDLQKEAERYHDIAFAKDDPTKRPPASESPKRGGTTGFEGIGDQGKTKPGKSDDSIARAGAELAREQATAAADAQKQASGAMLAELDAQHRMLLVSDGEFYGERLRLEVAALDAEKAALESQAKTLEDLYSKQRADKLLKRDKDGNSAEELRTARELLQIRERLGEVDTKGREAGSKNTAEVYAAGQAQELAGLRQAADLERERNSGLAARLALLQRENDLQAQKAQAGGGGDADVATVRQLGEVAAGKLRIAEVDRQIRDAEQDNRRAVDELNDAVAKDPRLKTAAAREINRLNADEARQLQTLVAQYDALAQTLGGDFLEKAKDLHAELDKLNRPDRKEDAAWTKTLIDGVEGIGNKIVETSGKGKNAWRDMAKSMEQDMLKLALKLAEEKYLTPLLNGAMGGALPAGGARPTFAPNLSANPQTPSAGKSALAGLTSALGLGGAAAGKGSGGPSVVINLTNESGSPVTASLTGQSFNASLEEFVVHAVLKDAGSGGVLSRLFAGGGNGGGD